MKRPVQKRNHITDEKCFMFSLRAVLVAQNTTQPSSSLALSSRKRPHKLLSMGSGSTEGEDRDLNACGYRGTCLKVLRALGKFATEEATALYLAITAGDMMQEELRFINLGA